MGVRPSPLESQRPSGGALERSSLRHPSHDLRLSARSRVNARGTATCPQTGLARPRITAQREGAPAPSWRGHSCVPRTPAHPSHCPVPLDAAQLLPPRAPSQGQRLFSRPPRSSIVSWAPYQCRASSSRRGSCTYCVHAVSTPARVDSVRVSGSRGQCPSQRPARTVSESAARADSALGAPRSPRLPRARPDPACPRRDCAARAPPLTTLRPEPRRGPGRREI